MQLDRLASVTLLPLATLLVCSPAVEAAEPLVAEYLADGRLAAGAQALEKRLEQQSDDQQARFSLGIVQFLQAVESLAQSHYGYGLLQHRLRAAPILRLPVPLNDDPEEISYEKARDALQQFVDNLELAERTLSKVDASDVKLPVHFGRIRLDLDGNGEATEEEAFWKIYTNLNRRLNRENGEAFVIAFDGGDVHWLRGYCHLLMSMGEFTLAHDWQDLFERTAHLFYPRVKSAHPQLQAEGTGKFGGFQMRNVLDVVAFIHLINFKVVGPERMQRSLEHLEAMAVQSRLSWNRILSEKDNDREWLPNPKQTGVIPNVAISRGMIDAWVATMNEMEAIFRGKKLLPYWRGEAVKGNGNTFEDVINQQLGVNFRRIFTEPTRFDLVMWLQGTAATPYLESYAKTGKPPVDAKVFGRLVRVFQGEFIGFALWFN